MAKSPEAFRTISEAAEEVGVPQHVLRFWEGKFSFVAPVKRAGGRRFYRPEDIALLQAVRRLVHDEGLTLKGVARLHRSGGSKRLLSPDAIEAPAAAAPSEAESPPPVRTPPVLDADRRRRLTETLARIETVRARLDAVLSR